MLPCCAGKFIPFFSPVAGREKMRAMSGTTSPRRFGLALLALALCLLAPIAWMLSLDSPWLRRTGAAGWALAGLGVLLGLLAARADRRWRVRLLAGLDVLLLAGFAFLTLVLTAVPASSAGELERAPDFTLPDQASRPVTLSTELARGPILLVFYRGHW